jgi:hypothetical protein
MVDNPLMRGLVREAGQPVVSRSAHPVLNWYSTGTKGCTVADSGTALIGSAVKATVGSASSDRGSPGMRSLITGKSFAPWPGPQEEQREPHYGSYPMDKSVVGQLALPVNDESHARGVTLAARFSAAAR